MSLFEKWQEQGTDFTDQASYTAYWNAFFDKEKDVYVKILENKEKNLEGKLSDLSQHYNMTTLEMVGFLDGINTSLEEEIDLNTLEEDSEVKAVIDYEKLLFNMYKAKADWLYNIEAWDDIIDDETRQRIKKDYQKSGMARKEIEIGRNDPCLCGSGKKYKKCCLNK